MLAGRIERRDQIFPGLELLFRAGRAGVPTVSRPPSQPHITAA